MTTSLSKSTIPEWDPKNSYNSPRQVPRVKYEGHENYLKHRGSLNIGDWSIQSNGWESARPEPRLKYEEAKQSYIKNRGCMNELLGGYADPALERKGPRIKKEAENNFNKNKGTFHTILTHEKEEPKIYQPKVSYEGMNNRITGNGTVSSLFTNYGFHPLSAKPVPRVKFDGADFMANNNGSEASKTLSMVPPSTRPSSTIFFQPR
jgi:hypothetical protein